MKFRVRVSQVVVMIWVSLQRVCVCVCTCTCYIVRTRENKFFTNKVRTFLAIKGVLAGPHNVKGLFEGKDLVLGWN